MGNKISVVINTRNEKANTERVIRSVGWADEVLVCDMYSEDGTAEIAKKLGAKVINHKPLSFVEPARNFAISKASGDWILILDPDEEVPKNLGDKLRELVENHKNATFVEIPRKNIIFGKWVKASMWWPDYNIRFFRKGKVTWSDAIHRPPKTEGEGIKLPEKEEYALDHYHYTGISQFLLRMNRYTTIQAEELENQGYKFSWPDLIAKPMSEFLGRYFANYGFKDGLHGLALSLLQAFSFLIVYLKVWELEKFKEQEIGLSEVKEVSRKAGEEIHYWFKYTNLSKNPLKNIIQRARNKLI